MDNEYNIFLRTSVMSLYAVCVMWTCIHFIWLIPYTPRKGKPTSGPLITDASKVLIQPCNNFCCITFFKLLTIFSATVPCVGGSPCQHFFSDWIVIWPAPSHSLHNRLVTDKENIVIDLLACIHVEMVLKSSRSNNDCNYTRILNSTLNYARCIYVSGRNWYL